MKITKIGNQTLWRALCAVFALLLILGIAGNAVTREWSGYINAMLGVSGTKIVTDENSNEDPIHYKSEYTSHTDVLKNALDVSKQIQAEGTTLMTNKGGLPLAKNAKVTFLGYNSAEVALGGTGSGAGSAGDRAITLQKACESKLDYNKTTAAFYKDKYDNKVGFTESQGWGGTSWNFRNKTKATEINASEFTSEFTGSFAQYKDAAIYIMSRIGGEGSDLSAADKYLALTDDEKSVLEAMKNGPFEKRIVLLNTLNTPEIGWLDEYNVDACVHIGAPGEAGLESVINILIGDVNPSGKLGDTYVVNSFSAPAMQNFGDFTFANAAEINNRASQKYLMYNEGIYVGYRYYETRYEDCVLQRGNAASSAGVYASKGNWNYSEEVAFPFGYGLSYTTFTQTLDSVTVNEGEKMATVKVTVKNTGAKDGKEVVEVYAQAPYMSPKQMVYAGGDLNLATLRQNMWTDYSATSASDVTALRKASKNILYTVLGSNSMNAKISRYLPPLWLDITIVIMVVITVALAVWGVLVILRTKKGIALAEAEEAAAEKAREKDCAE